MLQYSDHARHMHIKNIHLLLVYHLRQSRWYLELALHRREVLDSRSVSKRHLWHDVWPSRLCDMRPHPKTEATISSRSSSMNGPHLQGQVCLASHDCFFLLTRNLSVQIRLSFCLYSRLQGLISVS